MCPEWDKIGTLMTDHNQPAGLKKNQAALKRIRCFMLDMDGTFYLGHSLLPGALEFMQKIASDGQDYLFLTNNSSKNAEIYTQKLLMLGFDIPESKILTSGEATTIYLKKMYPGAGVYLVGTSSLEDEFKKAGIHLINKDGIPDVIVLGFDTSLTYEKIWKFCDYVRADIPYIATHPDFNCPVENGFMPDIGSFIALIKASTGRKPDVIIGKPHRHIVDAVVEKTGYSINEIAMVGDRLYTDIALGETGILTVLVLSGETSAHDIAESQFKPDIVVDNLMGLVQLLE
jgi:4-nitrophenyl phosphatase